MDKYFLFKQGDVTENSKSVSDATGKVSVFAIPVSRMAYLSAEKGRVIFVFNDASPYEDNNLTDGESIKKTNVAVPVEDGKEVELIEDIMGFLSRKSEAGRNVFRFDDFNVVTDIKTLPVKRTTGKESSQSFIGSTDAFTPSVSNVIDGVDFLDSDNLPFVDYNGTNLTGTAPITAWANDAKATGGSTYDISTVTGSPTSRTTKLKDGKTSVKLSGNQFFTLPSALTVSSDYTTYVAFHLSSTTHITGLAPVYLSSNETLGINCTFLDGIKFPRTGKSVVTLRHEGRTGYPAQVFTEDSYIFPDQDVDDPNFQSVYVFVIRRDRDFNIHVYNHLGVKFATIPAKVYDKYAFPLTSDGLTDGDLVINTLFGDSANAAQLTNFGGDFARFGVINKDVGENAAVSIAKQLFETYNP